MLSEQKTNSAEAAFPLYVGGPTAVGKSEIALRLAETLGGEMISVDSMQVYRGLDIGTAKPGAAEREKIPHHLVDVVELTESFDAAKFVRLAGQAVAEIQARNKIPIFCGGTGLYFKAWLSGLGEAPAANPELRAELEAMPFETLLRELRERDPATCDKIDKRNPRRVIRAVEVIRLTGKPFSTQRARWSEIPGGPQNKNVGPQARSPRPIKFYCFTRQPADLHARINARVDEMFRRGLVAETRALLERGLAQNPTAMQAIGYRQVVEYLRGERNLPETIELVKLKTRQFAKRQLTWFRRHGNCEWIELRPNELVETVVAKLGV
jgi:tRNA dimethylallyltransferase